ncbi:PXPV repeat-containing protein [Paucimonas lemoignei]|uniref:PXPV repeat-containing protein n=1 Tax=Paucimonas lemoignei TaxID=29443 RepID=A0A4R3I1N2_PAULE|nr:PXPV repeat protein [Paucimonas lemoignei]TCS38621.1 PXPV repeat-containing protein [Paucimonas lemoignei]
MNSKFFSATLAGMLLALSAVTSVAHAGDRSGVNWSVGISSGPAVVYAPPPPVYAYPQPVYVQPQPVYVEPAPVVVYGGSGYVTYGQPYYVEQRPGHHHHHHRDYNGGNFRQGR